MKIARLFLQIDFLKAFAGIMVGAHLYGWGLTYMIGSVFGDMTEPTSAMEFFHYALVVTLIYMSPFVFAFIALSLRLVTLHFADHHVTCCAISMIAMLVGERMVVEFLGNDQWMFAFYGLLVALAGFIVFLYYFAEGPDEQIQRRKTRLVHRN